MIPLIHRANFKTLVRACLAGDLALLEAIDNEDPHKARVTLLVAVQRATHKDPHATFCPIAVLCEGNPYNRYEPDFNGAPPMNAKPAVSEDQPPPVETKGP